MEILTAEQKARNDKLLNKALIKLKATVLKNRLLRDIVIDVKPEQGFMHSRMRSIILKTTGKLILRTCESTPSTDWSDGESSESDSPINLRVCNDLGITPEQINEWRKRLE